MIFNDRIYSSITCKIVYQKHQRKVMPLR